MAEMRLIQWLRDYFSRFSRSFWTANVSELFERIAFYGMSPVLVPYLVEDRHFDKSGAIALGGKLGFFVYFLTIPSGIIADWLGYRRAMIVAYVLLAAGYAGVWKAPSVLLVTLTLAAIALGASVIKPAITGTVQRSCSPELLPIGFSIYYTLVNIGGFVGQVVSGVLATAFGRVIVFPIASVAVVAALAIALILYVDVPPQGPTSTRTFGSLARDFFTVVTSVRLMSLFLLIAGFWSLFFHFFGAIMLYLQQNLGLTQRTASFIIALDGGFVVIAQVMVGHRVRHWSAGRALWIAALIGAVGYGVMGLRMSPWLAVVGVLTFAVGEMLYAAHFYRYLGSLAPIGQEGLYLGFAFLPIALGSLLAGWIGGPVSTWAIETIHAPEKMCWVFGAVSLVAALGLWIHARIYAVRDARA